MSLSRLHIAVLGLVLSCGSCGDNAKAPKPPPTELLRDLRWPGGGRELTIVLPRADASDQSGGIVLSETGGRALDYEVRPTPMEIGALALVIELPADKDTLLGFVRSRPTSERIGLFLIRGGATQLAGFTRDRDVLEERIASLSDALSSPRGNVQQVIDEVTAELHEVEGDAPKIARAIVLAGPSAPSQLSSSLPIVSLRDGSLADTSAQLQTAADTQFYSLAFCERAADQGYSLAFQDRVLELAPRGRLVEDTLATCDPSSILDGTREFTDTLRVSFTQSERVEFDKRIADLSKADFQGSLQLTDAGPAIPITAHIRGKGTLLCERKSFTLRLDGPARSLLPNSLSDEYYLVSMCTDDRYIEQYTANQLLTTLGLFPWKFRYVELRIDDETQGVYLLLEKAREELVRDNSKVRSVSRRRFAQPDTFFEIKYNPSGHNPEESYRNALGESSLPSRLRLRSYLRYLAAMSAFGNGDYVDEVWLVAMESIDAQGNLVDDFRVSAWDIDDLFSECHYNSAYAYDDPFALAYCAEAEIDHRILADPTLYALYVDELEALLNGPFSADAFDSAAQQAVDDILPFIDKPGVSAAMVTWVESNPQVVNPKDARADLQNKLTALQESFRDRRASLLSLIEDYKNR